MKTEEVLKEVLTAHRLIGTLYGHRALCSCELQQHDWDEHRCEVDYTPDQFRGHQVAEFTKAMRRQRKAANQRVWSGARRARYFAGKVCENCGATENLHLAHRDRSTKVDSHIWSWSQERCVKCARPAREDIDTWIWERRAQNADG